MKTLSFRLSAMVTMLLFAGCSEPDKEVARPPLPPAPSVSAVPAPPVKKNTHDTWQKAQVLLNRCDAESQADIERRLAQIDALIVERKALVPKFVEEVLGVEAKARLAGGMMEQSINAVGEAIGQGKAFPEDSFRQYVADTFRTRVLKPSEVGDRIRSVVKAWRDDWRSLDNRLLVELKADLDQSSRDYDESEFRHLIRSQDEVIDGIISTSVDDACSDLAQSATDFAISWIASEMITNQIVSQDDSTASKLAVNVGVGYGVDKAIKSIRGPDTQTILVAKINASLDRMAAEIKGGSAAKPGLRGSLRQQQYSNLRMRKATLFRLIFGRNYVEIV